MSTHVVTGATGFVGAALVLELLATDPSSEIWCLARPNTRQPASERLFQSLQQMAHVFPNSLPLLHQAYKRCHVLEGDLSLPQCGISSAIARQVPTGAQFWHSAASLNYENRYAEEIERINIQGALQALALARLLKIEHFNYFSTSYVAGTRTGLIPEALMEREQETNNLYERSKIIAEYHVAAAEDLAPRIFRPSVVIGHSQSYEVANSYSGLYGFMRRIAKSVAIMERLDRHYLREHPLKIRYEPAGLLNLVPIDHVVQQAVCIGTQPQTDPFSLVYHLTNATPIRIEDFLTQLFRYMHLLPPIAVEDSAAFNEIDQAFARGIEFYNSYLLFPKHFSRTYADASIEQHLPTGCQLDERVMQGYFDWYLTYLQRTDPKTIDRAHLQDRVSAYLLSQQKGVA